MNIRSCIEKSSPNRQGQSKKMVLLRLESTTNSWFYANIMLNPLNSHLMAYDLNAFRGGFLRP